MLMFYYLKYYIEVEHEIRLLPVSSLGSKFVIKSIKVFTNTLIFQKSYNITNYFVP